MMERMTDVLERNDQFSSKHKAETDLIRRAVAKHTAAQETTAAESTRAAAQWRKDQAKLRDHYRSNMVHTVTMQTEQRDAIAEKNETIFFFVWL